MIDRSTMPVLLLLGPPGAGKATQARLLEDRFGLTRLSVADLLKQEIATGTDAGRFAQVAGNALPDDVIFSVLQDRMAAPDCAAGVVLDGFPQTVGQARELEMRLAAQRAAVNAAIRLDLDDGSAVTRLMGRQRCDTCGETYHLTLKSPDAPGKCDRCGGGQIYRSVEDTPDNIRTRLTKYHQEASDVSDFYNSRDVLRPMNAAVEIDTITQHLRHVVRPIVTELWGCVSDRKKKPNCVEETQ